MNVTSEAKSMNSQPTKLGLNSLKEIYSKYKITIKKDFKPQDNPIVQEEGIESTSRPKEYEELNKRLENIIENQPTNGNDYGNKNSKKESRKPNIKNNVDDNASALPQEVTSPPKGFSKVLRPEASLKKENNEIQKLQPFPSNMVNIGARLIIENENITNQNLQYSKIGIGKSEKDWSKELIQDPKEESDTYLPEKNNLFHILTSNKA
ncbi:hypothetical protein O181_064395 [Austropuccinia psidii MF-1]|uniref:Uncharacterized protein n=1 Tax=Austropuccinia psidii MF-1 TaxID=1389203 RepID=A0A9Q3I339_9BASI|nr:hypothetical protein [Austropuccinia psidii MF-1]